jgi:ABC-type sugar transport system ATPase subunit
MLGRPASRTYPDKRLPPVDSPVALMIRNLSAPGVRDVSMMVRAGEIVGLAGLIGAGRSELARAVYGAASHVTGETLAGTASLGGSPVDSIRAGVALIPESRKDDGLLLRRPIRENVSLASLAGLHRLGFIRGRAERVQVAGALARVSGTSLLEAPAGALSGGNQQKLLFARALLAKPSVLIADEPTRGVDVGAKLDLYELLVDLAAGGVAILLISNEMEELLGLAHRVVVMRKGRVAAELAGTAMTEAAILAAAFGTGGTGGTAAA